MNPCRNCPARQTCRSTYNALVDGRVSSDEVVCGFIIPSDWNQQDSSPAKLGVRAPGRCPNAADLSPLIDGHRTCECQGKAMRNLVVQVKHRPVLPQEGSWFESVAPVADIMWLFPKKKAANLRSLLPGLYPPQGTLPEQLLTG
jgi:hypothetical protein